MPGTLCLYMIAVTGSNNWKQDAVAAVEVTTAGSTYVKNLCCVQTSDE